MIRLSDERMIRNSAFTLLELSIVLVIIGLIVGGVMVGRDLIEASKIRAQVTQFSDIETQINTFNVKYNCLPGDCPNATDLLGTGTVTYDANNIACNSTVCNGNNDGYIKSVYASATYYGSGECLNPSVGGEISQMFKQLSLAGFGDYTRGILQSWGGLIGTDFPYAKYGNGTGVYVTCLASTQHPLYTPSFLRSGNSIVVGTSAAGTNAFRVGYSVGSYSVIFGGVGYGWGMAAGIATTPIGIPADVARMIDEKIDDGKPSNGKFGVIAGSSSACDNALLAMANLPLLTSYPSPDTQCDVVAGKALGRK